MTVTTRLLSGPALDGRAEPYLAHLGRLGPVPLLDADVAISMLEATGMRGRGGAGFPVGRKWRAIADRHGNDRPVIVANGAEGEPESAKDRVLMEHRPHLVLDGALLAARSLGADRVEVFLGREHTIAVRAMKRAIDERPAEDRKLLHVVEAPVGYVAGEATAAVHYVNSRDARPTMTPPRMSERGVAKRPTLVQNVESLAYAALVARFGPAWYREAGRGTAKGTSLVTLAGAVRQPGVTEIELGMPLGELIDAAGGTTAPPQAVLLGGWFGSWAEAGEAWSLPLDPEALGEAGLSFGCGLVSVLGADECGVAATARIIAFLADQSADQCGPCRFGLPAIADATLRVAAGRPKRDDLANAARWTELVDGRGACRHPDGAAQLMRSAFSVFADDFEAHASRGRCLAAASPAGTRR